MREKICTRIGKSLFMIETRDILRFSAEEKYVVAHTPLRSLYFEGTLKELEVEFAANFVRIHRAHLVRRDLLCSFRWNGYLASVGLVGSLERLPVGRSRCVEVRAQIDKPGADIDFLGAMAFSESANAEAPSPLAGVALG